MMSAMRASASRAWSAASAAASARASAERHSETISAMSSARNSKAPNGQRMAERDRGGAEPGNRLATGWMSSSFMRASIADLRAARQIKTGTIDRAVQTG